MQLQLPLPNSIITHPIDVQELAREYIDTLTDIDSDTYMVAYNHFGEMFDVVRIKGFLDYIDAKNLLQKTKELIITNPSAEVVDEWRKKLLCSKNINYMAIKYLDELTVVKPKRKIVRRITCSN